MRSLILWLNRYRFDVYLLYSAVAASSWSVLPLSFAGADPRYVVGTVFLGGIAFAYLFNKFTDQIEDAISQPESTLSSVALSRLSLVVGALVLVPPLVLWQQSLPVWPYLVYLMVAFVYSYPLVGNWRLKNITGVKTLWAPLGVFLPVLFGLYVYFPAYAYVQYQVDLAAIAAFFIIFMVGEMIWDIRDAEGDKAAHVLTIPVVFGITTTKAIAGALLMIAGYLMPLLTHHYIILAVMFSFLYLATPRSPRWYFHFMLYVLSIIIFFGLWVSLP